MIKITTDNLPDSQKVSYKAWDRANWAVLNLLLLFNPKITYKELNFSR